MVLFSKNEPRELFTHYSPKPYIYCDSSTLNSTPQEPNDNIKLLPHRNSFKIFIPLAGEQALKSAIRFILSTV